MFTDGLNAATWNGGAINNIVQANNGALYLFYVNSAADIIYKKSTNGGLTWSTAVAAATAGTATQIAVWYDRWTDPSGGLGDRIHFVHTDSGNDDVFYRTLDTSSDSLSTQTTIFAGASTAGGGHLAVTRAEGGNVYCKVVIDAGAEGGFFRLPNANVPNGAWDAARTVDEAIATLDQMILLPDYDSADTQDCMAIFWDASANEISRKLYDDSANSWAETSISTGMVEVSTATIFRNFDVAPDPANTRHVLVAWNGVDTANADLQCWIIDASTITAVTNVVNNGTDDQGLCAISIDTNGHWWVFYGGKSDGSETWLTAVNIYYKISKDAGSTWGPETKLNTGSVVGGDLRHLLSIPLISNIRQKPVAAWLREGASDDDIQVSVVISQPRATLQLGV
jgi:hypothetical protein